MAVRVPVAEVQQKALDLTKRLKKKRDAAPSWGDYIHKFGEGGAVRNSRGAIVGYRMPRSDDPEKQRAINNAVYEMWGPHRRIAVQQGAEMSAGVETMTLRDPASGRCSVVPATVASERRARKLGLVEVTRRGKPAYRVTYHGDGTRTLEVHGECVLYHAPEFVVKEYMQGLNRRLGCH